MPCIQCIAPTGDIRLLQSHLSVGNMRGSEVALTAEVLFLQSACSLLWCDVWLQLQHRPILALLSWCKVQTGLTPSTLLLLRSGTTKNGRRSGNAWKAPGTI